MRDLSRASSKRWKRARTRSAKSLTWQMGRPIRYTPIRDPPRLRRARALHDGDRTARAGRHPIAPDPASSLHPPRAGGCRAHRRAVELPVSDGRQLRRARAARRQCRQSSSTPRKRRSRRAASRGIPDAGLPEGVFQFLHVSHDDGRTHHRRSSASASSRSPAPSQAARRAARRERSLHRHRPRTRR